MHVGTDTHMHTHTDTHTHTKHVVTESGFYRFHVNFLLSYFRFIIDFEIIKEL